MPFFFIGFESVSSSVGDKAGCEHLRTWAKSSGLTWLVLRRFFRGAATSRWLSTWTTPAVASRWREKGAWAGVGVKSQHMLTLFVRQFQGSHKDASFNAVGWKWTGSESRESLGEKKIGKSLERNSQYHFLFQRGGTPDHFYFHVGTWRKTLFCFQDQEEWSFWAILVFYVRDTFDYEIDQVFPFCLD